MRKFTPEEDQFIRDNYLTMSSHSIDKALGRTRGAVRQRMARIGVVVPEEIRQKFIEDSLIKPGHVPANKGKKISRELRDRLKHTWFQKGHQPHNQKDQDGVIVERTDKAGRKYKYIREAVGKWELLHRHLWRKHHGEIPKKMIVAFKDGNSLNCVIENLELIDMKTNMARNSIMNLPQEIRTAYAHIRAFNRKINRYEQDNQ